jgi:hypothetical protein
MVENPARSRISDDKLLSPSSYGGVSTTKVPWKEDPPLDYFAYGNENDDDILSVESIQRILTNESSTCADVSRACLWISQFAGSGNINNNSNNHFEDGSIFHDVSYVDHCRWYMEALSTTIQSHEDRRCRIYAIQTLGILARSAYARIRPITILMSQRDFLPLLSFTDEITSDIPTLLITTAATQPPREETDDRDDDDDEIPAICIASLSNIVLSSCNYSWSQLGDTTNELCAELHRLASAGSSPYAPSLRSVTDEDPTIVQTELQIRIMEVIAPRMVGILDRVLRWKVSHQMLALPLLTAYGIYNYQKGAGRVAAAQNLDQATYARTWSELDANAFLHTIVHYLILPNATLTAAMAGLHLASQLRPSELDIVPLCRHAILIWRMRNEQQHVPTEYRLGYLSAMIIAMRALDLSERIPVFLHHILPSILDLPATIHVPNISTCAGLRITDDYEDNYIHKTNVSYSYRRPVRVALWTECALQFFLDGPCAEGRSQRVAYLHQLLSSPVLNNILSDNTITKNILAPRDELLLAFTTVAIETGRRFRGTVGNTVVTDPLCEPVLEWLDMTNVVLHAFFPCASVKIKGNYLEENLSMLTAGLASYVQLLQEYLHLAGLLHPSSSVALKLAASACPPHILWDRMTESANFISRFPSVQMDRIEQTTKLVDEVVSREQKHGISSHHMRLFILALAADHWVQCRIALIRQHLEDSNASHKVADSQSFSMHSGREILRQLAPKRLLAMILKAHVPPVDKDGKPKRDPIQKLALECVRVSVACIENVALMACDWRRRFGSSQETKHLVSIAVGLLQGKVDETAMTETMKSVMSPTCDLAVRRIQAFYESVAMVGPGTDSNFPLSELVMKQVKIKIKPLVSSSRQSIRPRDDFVQEYLVQLCRQIVASRVLVAVLAFPSADPLFQSLARPFNWLRLSVPPISETRDARLHGFRSGNSLKSWGHSVKEVSSPSDPVQVILAYLPQRLVRYDGEEDYRITVLMRAFNMTPIDFVDGLRFELGFVERNELFEDPASMTHLTALGCRAEDASADIPLMNKSITFKNELKAGEFLTWEVDLSDVPYSCALTTVPSIVYRQVRIESHDAESKWVGGKPSSGEKSVEAETKTGEDDFQVASSNGNSSFNRASIETQDIRVTGLPIVLPSMIALQPCPLVFFVERYGDVDSFRLLWFRFPYQLAPINISPQRKKHHSIPHPTTQKIAKMSSLVWEGEAIPGGVATRLWAFMSYAGHRAYCVLTEADGDNVQKKQTLHFRGDDRALLFSLAGTESSREIVVSSLIPGMSPC